MQRDEAERLPVQQPNHVADPTTMQRSHTVPQAAMPVPQGRRQACFGLGQIQQA
jgi:hypothetical protein